MITRNDGTDAGNESDESMSEQQYEESVTDLTEQEHRRSVAADLDGLRRLATNAVHLTTQLVEAEHSRLDWFSRMLYRNNREVDRAPGIAGMVYHTIYTVNGLVGTGLGILISQLAPMLGDSTLSFQREMWLAILNGVIGDHLHDEGNPLAIRMQFRVKGIPQSDDMLLRRIQQSSGRLLLLIHGSCMSDLQWLQQGHDHGAALTAAMDSNSFAPIYVNYNSGLHISQNGKLLAAHLNRLAGLSKEPLTIHVLAHSMGGLVIRSACHYAASSSERNEFNSNDWLSQVKKIVFLGTPHHGALLEQGGKWVDYLLSLHPYSEPFSWLGKIRSTGVTDLGYGNIRDEDWSESCSPATKQKCRLPTPPLPLNVQCYAIAAITSDQESTYVRDQIIGDGLVTENSALGQGHWQPEFNLVMPPAHRKTIRKVSHVGLLSNLHVYASIQSFLSET
jgi:pimeloyl-ACP methyl ester carboxylesterase